MSENPHGAAAPSQSIAASDTSMALSPRTLEEAKDYARIISQSDLVPTDYKNNAPNCLVAMQMGIELGLPPLQAIQNIAVINGRPAVWGDLLPALARRAPGFEYINESFDNETSTATCKVKRKNEPEQTRTFSQVDAVAAGVWGKAGPWTQYPRRMLQLRARSFAIRDVFADALRGCSVYEEAIDITPRDYSVVDAPAPAAGPCLDANQAHAIQNIIKTNGLNPDEWVNYFKETYNAETIGDIPASAYKKIISTLNAAISNRYGVVSK